MSKVRMNLNSKLEPKLYTIFCFDHYEILFDLIINPNQIRWKTNLWNQIINIPISQKKVLKRLNWISN